MSDDMHSREELVAELEALRRERSVERAAAQVREAVLDMRKSDDLLQVLGLMYLMLRDQGLTGFYSLIQFFDEDKDLRTTYFACDNPRQAGIAWTSPAVLEFNEDIIVFRCDEVLSETSQSTYRRWRRGEVSHSSGEPTWLERINREFVERFGFDRPLPLFERDMAHATYIPFEQGLVRVIGPELDDAEVAVGQQLTEAMSLGYLRYLDFQKIDEAQRQLIDELEAELNKAHEMQMGLMPKESPEVAGVDVAGRCIPANHVGGDFFQYFAEDGKLSLCMADVTGHAMEAAIPVVMFSGILHSQMELGESLEALFGRLNRTMHRTLAARTFVCFAMGELDLARRSLRVANGGIPYPYHYRAATGEVVELEVDAYPLGVRAAAEYGVVEAELEPGDYVVFCSDGIIEAVDGDGELFGFERLAEAVRAGCAQRLEPQALINAVFAAVRGFCGDAVQEDDQTLVVLRIADEN